MDAAKKFFADRMGVTADYIPIIALCAHCGEPVVKSQKFCKDCHTKEERKKVCDINNEIRSKHSLQVLKCNYCESS